MVHFLVKDVVDHKDYERLAQQEKLIISTSEVICEVAEKQSISFKAMAQKIGKSLPSISRLLSGDRNLTLRNLSDLAFSLDMEVSFKLQPNKMGKQKAWERFISERLSDADLVDVSLQESDVPVPNRKTPRYIPYVYEEAA